MTCGQPLSWEPIVELKRAGVDTFDSAAWTPPTRRRGRRKAIVHGPGYGVAPELDAGRRARARLTGAAVAKLR